MQREVIFVRHAQTVANVERKYLGHLDSPVTTVGVMQEQQLCEALRNEPVVSVYGSDLPRAANLAHRIAGYHHIKAELSAQLREMHFGVFEGLTYEEVMMRYPKAGDAFYADSLYVAPPAGESALDVLCRFYLFMSLLIENPVMHRQGVHVVVTHGGPLRLFLALTQYGDPKRHWEVKVEHGAAIRCAVSVIERVLLPF